MVKQIKNLADSIENANELTKSLLTMSKGIENNGLEITILIKPLGDRTMNNEQNQANTTEEVKSDSVETKATVDATFEEVKQSVGEEEIPQWKIDFDDRVKQLRNAEDDARKTATNQHQVQFNNVVTSQIGNLDWRLTKQEAITESISYESKCKKIIENLYEKCKQPIWKFWASSNEKLTDEQLSAIQYFRSGDVAIPPKIQSKIIHIMKVHKETYSEWFIRNLAYNTGLLPGDVFLTRPEREILIKLGVVGVGVGGTIVILNHFGLCWINPYVERVFSLPPGTLGS